ncbi:hypothetical protein GQR58_029058 [Nymphon striatum]|nr:hypothetical protein GQR58_029058 [Nymphon striatum]
MAHHSIVDHVMTAQAIVEEKVTGFSLFPSLLNKMNTLQWAASRGLIANTVTCSFCNQPCVLAAHPRLNDGWRWRCYRDNFTRTVRYGSYFFNSHIEMCKLIYLIYLWAYDCPQIFMKRELEVSHVTIIDWCSFLREVAEQYLEANPMELGGMDEDGEPIVVEIDESKFFHRKYNRGQWREGHWVFGAIERDTGRCCLVEVADRRRQTLIPIIEQWILPGSRIISDGWAAYAGIDRIRNGIYIHDVIVHQNYFVDPEDPEINTQYIENTWMRSKEKLRRQHGTSDSLFQSYIAEFLWRQRVGPNKFGAIIDVIKNIYPV